MQTYQFTVYLQGVEVMTDDMAERLFEAGCDDGTPSSGNGIAKVRFHREAKSLEDAIASAVGQIRHAGLNVASVEIDDDALQALAVGAS